MKKIIFSVLALASLLIVGCNVKDFEPAAPVQDGMVRVSASLDITKVGVGAEVGKFAWEAGDVIGVWTGNAFTPFTIETSSVGSVAGTFAGTLPEGGAINDASYAVYPYCEADTLDVAAYTSKYQGDNWQFKSHVPMAAKATATANGNTVASYKFGHLAALAMLKLKNIPVEAKSIFFESTKQLFFISGTADLSAEYPKFNVEETADYCFMSIPEHSSPIDMTVFVPLNMGEFADPKFRFTLFSCTTGDDFDWGAEMDKAVYNHSGFLNTGGYINRGDLFVLPEVDFAPAAPGYECAFDVWNNESVAVLERTDDMALTVLKTAKFTADAENLYVYMELDQAKQYGPTPDFNVMMDFYIDCDGDPATGGIRSDVFNHGVNWYYETFVADAGQIGLWDSGQYEYIGEDGGSIWSLNNHGGEFPVETAGFYDADNDFAYIEAKLSRTDFKLVNTKAAFGIAILDGTDGWEAMGKLPQNDDLSMFVVDLPAYAGAAEPAEIALTADMISTNAPMEYLNGCGGGTPWVMYEPYGLTDAADWVNAITPDDAAAREAQLGLAANMWDGDANTAFMTNLDIWELGGGWATRSGSAKTDHYVQITFSEPVNGVKMFLKNGPYYPFGDAGFNIAVSADGSAFANTAASPYANAGVGTEITIDEIKGDAPVKAIRILNNAAADWTNNGPVICISELKLWGLQ